MISTYPIVIVTGAEEQDLKSKRTAFSEMEFRSGFFSFLFFVKKPLLIQPFSVLTVDQDQTKTDIINTATCLMLSSIDLTTETCFQTAVICATHISSHN